MGARYDLTNLFVHNDIHFLYICATYRQLCFQISIDSLPCDYVLHIFLYRLVESREYSSKTTQRSLCPCHLRHFTQELVLYNVPNIGVSSAPQTQTPSTVGRLP